MAAELEALVGRRAVLVVASCNQLAESDIRKVVGVVLYVSKDRIGVRRDDGAVEVVDRGWVVEARAV
ncbi:MAG: hypothetical protein QXP31_01775 [Pyrobaculum sp.]